MIWHDRNDAIAATTNNLFVTTEGTSAVWPWISKEPLKAWYEGVDRTLKPYFNHLRNILSKRALTWEQEHLEKALPRNTRDGIRVRQTFVRMADVLQNLHKTDDYLLKKWKDHSWKIQGPPVRLDKFGEVEPTRNRASLGATNVEGLGMLTGEKGDYWFNCQIQAKAYYEFALTQSHKWTWEKCTPELMEAIVKELRVTVVPFVRYDNNMAKPRVIWCGDGAMTVLERPISDRLLNAHPQFRKDRVYGNLDMIKFAEMHEGENFISADMSNYDWHGRWELIKEVSRWFQESLRIPESVAVMLFAYQCATPLSWIETVDHKRTLYTLDRCGGFMSGSAYFVPLEQTLMTSMANECISGQLDGVACLASNDDHVVVFNDGGGYRRQMERYGQVVKGDSIVPRKDFSLLKKWYNCDEKQVEPIWASRLRNMLCPVVQDPEKYCRIEPCGTALRLRGAVHDLELWAAVSTKHNALWKYWTANVCPLDRLRLKESIQELAAACRDPLALYDLQYKGLL